MKFSPADAILLSKGVWTVACGHHQPVKHFAVEETLRDGTAVVIRAARR
jgi:hypothetical protein